MKTIRLIAFAAIAVMTMSLTNNADAQFRWGLKAGMTINSLHFDKSSFDDSNRTGWTAGVTTEFTIPVIGLGFDLSALYVRRNAKFADGEELYSANRSYIEIPLNIKYKLSIPAVSSIIKPYVATGPSVSVLTSRKTVSNLYHNRGLDWAWNFGFGVELFKHLQVGANYGLGINKAMRAIGTDAQGFEAKNRSWTIAAAYYF